MVLGTGNNTARPINFALQAFGDPSSLLVIRDLMFTERALRPAHGRAAGVRRQGKNDRVRLTDELTKGLRERFGLSSGD